MNSRSPRAWLLARHASATPQLDAAREQAIRSAPKREAAPSLFHALFHPNRLAWATLAVVWIALLAVRLASEHAAAEEPVTRLPPAAVCTWVAQLQSHEPLFAFRHQH